MQHFLLTVLKLWPSLAVGVVMCVPALLFLFGGASDEYGHDNQQLPSIVQVLAPDPVSRETFAKELTQRSIARPAAISMVNYFQLQILGSIETESVVSGAPGSLFYKRSLKLWDCPRQKKNIKSLERLRFLVDLAVANQIPVTFVSAPNKASIASEQLGGRVLKFMDCYRSFEKQYRSVLAELNGPHLIDHYGLLNNLHKSSQTYLRQDTHWTILAGVHALNETISRIPVDIPQLVPKAISIGYREGDLIKMLLLSEVEPEPVPEMVMRTPLDGQHSTNVVLVQDSFYNRLDQQVANQLAGVTRIGYPDILSAEDVKRFVSAQHIVIESVERSLMPRLFSPTALGWESPFGKWFISSMKVASDKCDWENSIDFLQAERRELVSTKNLIQVGPVLQAKSPESEIKVNAFVTKYWENACLRVTIESSADTSIRVLLQNVKDQSRGVSEARSIKFSFNKGIGRLGIVLPQNAMGFPVQLLVEQNEGQTFDLIALELAKPAINVPTELEVDRR